MAGIFDTSDLGGPQGSPISVKQPIEDRKGMMLESLSGVVSEGIKYLAEEKEDFSPVNALVKEQIKIANAVNRGDMTPAKASVLWGDNLNQAIMQNPHLDANDFLQAHSKAVGSAGVGQQAVEGTREYQREQKAISDASDAGYILPGMSPEQQEQGLNLYQQEQALMRNLEHQSKIISLQSSRIGLDKSTLELEESQQQHQSRELLNTYISTQRQKYFMQTHNIASRVNLPQDNPSYISKEEALQEYDRLSFTIKGQLQDIAPYAGSSELEARARPTLDYIETMKEVVSGKQKLNVANTAYDNSLKQMQVATLSQDPQMRALVATENMFRNSPINLSRLVTEKTIKALEMNARAANGTGTGGVVVSEMVSPAEKQNTRVYTKLLEGYSRDYIAGKLTDEQVAQLDNHNESVLKTVGSAKNSDAADLVPLVKYLASPSFKEYVKKRGGLPSGKEEAVQVLERQYTGQVIPAIREEITDRYLGFDLRDYVSVEWKGESALFRMNPEVAGTDKAFLVRQQVDKMNEEVAPHMTRLVNLSSTFSGESSKSEFENLLTLVGLEGGTFRETPEEVPETPEEVTTPQLHPEDVDWIKAATTLEEKKRRAAALGIPEDMINQATRGR